MLTMLLCMAPLPAQFPKAIVAPEAAERGAKIYAADCSRCHGEDARGSDMGADLLRSAAVLHDRREMLHGSELAPYLKSSPPHTFSYNSKQADDLSAFLITKVNSILRSGYSDTPTQMLNGDAKAGEAYFNGPGGCAKCHSATGDLAGVAKRYSTPALQQKFLFPNVGFGHKAPVQVTVASTAGKPVSGELLRIDDFTVTLKDTAGERRSINRTAGTRVTTVDPYAGHVALLDKYTDADIHNLTKYLDTLR
jgi:mono/diheme cytochrome c family protein